MARVSPNQPTTDLNVLLASIPGALLTTGQGPDIDDANVVLLDPTIDDEAKIARFRKWASRFQPCMFGRLGAKGLRGIRYDFCWINRGDLGRGSSHVAHKIQQARREWKEHAAEGHAHGFLVMFNAPELAFAQPGQKLIETCLSLCNLYLSEHAPLKADTIYTESLPFHETDGTTSCLKGGINIFYGSAHRTSNHDRRIPGGIMISVNSPGLFAHSLVKRGLAVDLQGALDAVRALAVASIGNGGLSRDKNGEQSCSWHNIDASRTPGECPMKHRPLHVPGNFDTNHYSALYHTDVLVPTKVMLDNSQDRPRSDFEVFPHLDLDYLSTAERSTDHENFGFVHGQRVNHEARYQHAWSPVPAPDAASAEHQP
jgi:hypothetical protein